MSVALLSPTYLDYSGFVLFPTAESMQLDPMFQKQHKDTYTSAVCDNLLKGMGLFIYYVILFSGPFQTPSPMLRAWEIDQLFKNPIFADF